MPNRLTIALSTHTDLPFSWTVCLAHPGLQERQRGHRCTEVAEEKAIPFGHVFFLILLTRNCRCFSSSLQVIMLRNDIHHCKASGIFLRLSSGGLIADNSIHSNCEAGVDIRKGANPLVLVRSPRSCAGGQRTLSLTCCFSPRGSRDLSPSIENTDLSVSFALQPVS